MRSRPSFRRTSRPRVEIIVDHVEPSEDLSNGPSSVGCTRRFDDRGAVEPGSPDRFPARPSVRRFFIPL